MKYLVMTSRNNCTIMESLVSAIADSNRHFLGKNVEFQLSVIGIDVERLRRSRAQFYKYYKITNKEERTRFWKIHSADVQNQSELSNSIVQLEAPYFDVVIYISSDTNGERTERAINTLYGVLAGKLKEGARFIVTTPWHVTSGYFTRSKLSNLGPIIEHIVVNKNGEKEAINRLKQLLTLNMTPRP